MNCEIAVKHADGQYLIMQRDLKKHHGGKWELTAGGAALKGETPLQCAMRELKEETGLICDKLVEVGRVVHHGQHAYYIDFLCTIDCDKSSVTLQEGETMNYRWVEKEELKTMDNLVTRRMQMFVRELR